MNPSLVYMPGDGYSYNDAEPFLKYLNDNGINTIPIPLQEENPDCSYEQLSTDNYCKYIDSYIPKSTPNLYGYGISKGCHWIRVYAARNPGKFKGLILVEETTMTPELMVKFEQARGNDYVEEFYHNPNEISGLDSTEKALDVIVSDKQKYCPKNIPIVLVFTARNNLNQTYTADVLALKRRYANYLKRNGCNVRVVHLNTDHCVDVHPEYFPKLLEIIKSIF